MLWGDRSRAVVELSAILRRFLDGIGAQSSSTAAALAAAWFTLRVEG